MTGPKEKVYDEQINPLMKEIMGICRHHKIPFVSAVELDVEEDEPKNPLLCVNILILKDWDSRSECLRGAAEALYPIEWVRRD